MISTTASFFKPVSFNKLLVSVNKTAVTDCFTSQSAPLTPFAPTQFGQLQSPQNPLTTSTGIQYYLGAATDLNLAQPTFPSGLYQSAQRLPAAAIQASAGAVNQAQQKIKDLYQTTPAPNSMGWLSKETLDKEQRRAAAIDAYVKAHFQTPQGKSKISDVIIVAMGGNIGTMKLAATAVADHVDGNTFTAKNGVRFHFVDTMEPNRLADLKAMIAKNPKGTVLNLVSQSGTTFETIAINTLLQADKALPPQNVIPMIGDPNSAIGSMAASLGYKPQANNWTEDSSLFSIPTWTKTGGRWTGNTAEPSFIVAMGGGKAEDWFKGYQSTIEDFLNQPEARNPVFQSALLDVAYTKAGFRDFYTFAYNDKLAGAGHALMQNVNESTPSLTLSDGKTAYGNGIAHKFLVAPAAQHADMATVTDFARLPIKLRLLMTQETNPTADKPIDFTALFKGKPMEEAFTKRANVMQGFTPSQLMNGMAAATAYDAWKRGRPVEFVTLPEISPKTMGGLIAEQYLRTMVWGLVNQVDVTREMAFVDYKGAFNDMIAKGPEQAGNSAAELFYAPAVAASESKTN